METPKEKAESLVEKFRDECSAPDEETAQQNGINCAKVAVELIIEIDTQKCLIKTIDLSRNNSTSSEWKTLSNYNLKHLVSDQKEFAYSKRYKNYLKKELC